MLATFYITLTLLSGHTTQRRVVEYSRVLMRAFFDELRERRSGIAIAMVANGSTKVAVDDGSDAIGEGSPFEIGSVTNTVTAWALSTPSPSAHHLGLRNGDHLKSHL